MNECEARELANRELAESDEEARFISAEKMLEAPNGTGFIGIGNMNDGTKRTIVCGVVFDGTFELEILNDSMSIRRKI